MFFREAIKFNRLVDAAALSKFGNSYDRDAEQRAVDVAGTLLNKKGEVPRSVDRKIKALTSSYALWSLSSQERADRSELVVTIKAALEFASKRRRNINN